MRLARNCYMTMNIIIDVVAFKVHVRFIIITRVWRCTAPLQSWPCDEIDFICMKNRNATRMSATNHLLQVISVAV